MKRQRNPTGWRACHLSLPEEQERMFVALRRAKSDVTAMRFDLVTIEPSRRWRFGDYDSDRAWSVSGRKLHEDGFQVVLSARRGSRLIFCGADL